MRPKCNSQTTWTTIYLQIGLPSREKLRQQFHVCCCLNELVNLTLNAHTVREFVADRVDASLSFQISVLPSFPDRIDVCRVVVVVSYRRRPVG